ALTERLIADITLKYEQGMVLRNDITRYELQLENLKLGLTRLIDKRSILNHQLCNSLNLPEGTQVVPDASLTLLQPAGHSQDEWQLLASTTSPVMQQQEIGVKMAEQRERLARSEMRPRVAFFAADNFNGPITFEIPPINKNINVWYLGVGVTYNIGALYKSNKKVKQAKLNTRQTMERKDVAAQNLNNSVQAAYTQLQQNYVELATQQKSVQLAQQNYDVVNERYLNQMALITDMVDASNIKLNAELQEVDARINILLAHYKMQYLAGTL
ncbi:MAG: TolC family protein, partial [Muribaculaceae bacterium]|nr:TolC family protein [Muribaculaceae bacterium]